MLSRAQALEAVKVGDLIFGIAAGGQEKLLFVYEADATSFWARHVTSQTTAKFGRDGESKWVHDGGSCTIVSTARLPQEMREVAIGLDRKFAARPEYPDSILSKHEIRLVLTYDEFFKANLLPGTEPIVRRAEKINAVREVLQLKWDPINASHNPPTWNEYLDDLPAVVSLLEKTTSVDEVTAFLGEMASRKERQSAVAGRSSAAAASLLRLRQEWG